MKSFQSFGLSFSFENHASAGGQLLHPSEVNNSRSGVGVSALCNLSGSALVSPPIAASEQITASIRFGTGCIVLGLSRSNRSGAASITKSHWSAVPYKDFGYGHAMPRHCRISHQTLSTD